MADYRAELDDAVATLDRQFDELKQAAARRLGSLFNPADYPATLVGLFGVSWDYPNVEPPDYLVGLSPDLYRQEQERVRARFEEAVQLAEQAFLDEFARLVAHLTERISGTNEDGTPKVFRDSAIDNLCELLRAVPLAERPQQPAARRAGGPGAAGRPRGGRPGPARQPVGPPGGRRAACHGPDHAGRDAGRAAQAADPAERLGGRGGLMDLLILPDGTVRAIYAEDIDLTNLGPALISRASHVEPDSRGRWLADLGPVGGPVLGPFDLPERGAGRRAGTGSRPTGSSPPADPLIVPSGDPSRSRLPPLPSTRPRPVPAPQAPGARAGAGWRRAGP